VLGEFGGRGNDTTFRVTNDYDGDGLADIIYLTAEQAPFVVSSATGAVVASWPLDGEHAPILISHGHPVDRDRDGRVEVLMGFLPAEIPFESGTYLEHVRFQWFGDDGPIGPFIEGWPARASPDLDGDGWGDVVVARDDELYLVNGTSGDIIAALGIDGQQGQFAAGRDADGDARPDIVVRDPRASSLTFFYSSR
jgi:hypothetical protein